MRITRVIERLGARRRQKKFYRVLDVARRVAGCGSLGLARWIVLVEGKGSPRGNYLLDLKEARPPAPRAGIRRTGSRPGRRMPSESSPCSAACRR